MHSTVDKRQAFLEFGGHNLKNLGLACIAYEAVDG